MYPYPPYMSPLFNHSYIYVFLFLESSAATVELLLPLLCHALQKFFLTDCEKLLRRWYCKYFMRLSDPLTKGMLYLI